MEGWVDRWRDGWVARWMGGWMDGPLWLHGPPEISAFRTGVSGFLLSFLHNHLLHSVPHLAPGIHWRPKKRTHGMTVGHLSAVSKWHYCWGTNPVTHTGQGSGSRKEALFNLSDWFFWPLYIRWSDCALGLATWSVDSRPVAWASPGSLWEMQNQNLHFNKLSGDSCTN